MKEEDKSKRSATMARIRSKNTLPEMAVRKLISQMGHRYRLHNAKLPGKPDIVFSGRKKIIFVHGCFWHGHDCRRGRNKPISNIDYWEKKLQCNYQRDQQNQNLLKEMGWSILTIWECELKRLDELQTRLTAFLKP
jgi:DNA mismatch endonuclease (patch repair protein)